MTKISVGDMTQYFYMRNGIGSVKRDFILRSREMATGEVADISKHLSGNFSELSDVERSLKANTSFNSVLVSARGLIDGQAIAFERARSGTMEFGVALLDAASGENFIAKQEVLAKGRAKLDEVVLSLNGQFAGRSLFSGASTHGVAFASSEEILSAFDNAASVATDSDTLLSIANSWFSIGGGYDGSVYLGSSSPIGGFSISPGETLETSLSGYDDEIRSLLKFYVVSSYLADEGAGLTEEEKSTAMLRIGQNLVDLNQSLISRQAELGVLQEKVEIVSASLSSEKFVLMEHRSKLIGSDPYESSVSMTEAEKMLEVLFSVTSMMSDMSLVKYL